MQRIVLRHLSGSKANQVEEFPIAYFNELIIGRDPSVTVKYDPDRDDLVGRQHAKILRDSGDGNSFILTDLNSRNGTFVNGQRIIGSARISPGDVVRFGAGGPEFQFDLDPGSSLQRNTDVAGSPGTTPPPTRSSISTIPPTRALPTAPQPVDPATGAGVGKATVERMLADTRSSSRKTMLIGGGALLLVILAVAGFLLYQSMASRKQLASEIAGAGPTAPSVIAKNNTASVVFIESGWDLVHTPSGDKVYHEFVRNVNPFTGARLIQNAKEFLPVYIQFDDGSIEPSLTTSSENGSQPIGGNLTGSGFVVSNEGYILTNRHVAAPWSTSYDLSEAFPGLIVRVSEGETQALPVDKSGKKGANTPLYTNQLTQSLRNWVPENARAFGRKPARGKLLGGRNVYLDVTFAKTELPYKASLKRSSIRHDVSMIKIDTPQSVPAVELLDNYDQAQPGETITILSYPAVSPDVVVGVKSHDPFNRTRLYKVVPDPTVTGGLIGKVIKDEQATSRREERDFISEFGDSIQLAANATGPGNSGGPVFDDHGRVIGLFFAGRRLQGDAQITFAVPIRYGMELMRTSAVLK
jgi:hypothetical protein